MNPIFVTFTGADDRTSVNDMRALSARYLIEWGILMNPSRQGISNRFPSWPTLSVLTASGLRLSAHLCGGHSRVVMGGAFPRLRCPLGAFSRAQVNSTRPSLPATRSFWDAAKGLDGVILQCRGSEFPVETAVSWLYDTSGGKGQAPTYWPPYPGRLVGYAGGISPENVRGVIRAIDAIGPYWLDMEGRVRTEDDWFDLNRCEQVCKEIYG